MQTGVPLNDNKTLKGPCIRLQYKGIELNALAIEATLVSLKPQTFVQ